MKIAVMNLAADAAGEIELDDAVYGLEPRADILQRMVKWQLAKRRAGTQRTKLRGEIARTKTRWGRQKGGGTARHGSKNAGIFVGGAKAHGPKPRSYEHDLPKQVRRLALKHALSSKAGAGALIILDDAKLDEPKTKALRSALEKLGSENALVIGGEAVDENFAKAARNLALVDVLPVQGINVYDVLRREKLVLTRAAVDAIADFFDGKGWPHARPGGADGAAAAEGAEA